jgi:putative transposase
MSKWHTPEEIGRLLAEVDSRAAAGDTVERVCREIGLGIATYYTWQKKYGRMSPGQLAWLTEILAENARLRRDLTALSLDNAILRHAVDETLSPRVKHQVVQHVRDALAVPERRVRTVLLSSRHPERRELLRRAPEEERLMEAIWRVLETHPRAGYRRIGQLLRAEGIWASDKQVYRLRRLLRSPEEGNTTP